MGLLKLTILKIVVVILGSMSLLSLPVFSQTAFADRGNQPAGHFFRYTMPDGRQEVGRQVPKAAIAAGYQVLDRRMRVIRVVRPAPSTQEIAQRKREIQRQEQDERLLQVFATSQDAKRARDRKVAALDVIVNISQGNILRLNLEYETLAALAAKKMRNNQAVPEQIQSNMSNIERQIQEAQSHIRKKEDEKRAIHADFEPDIKRLMELEMGLNASK